MKSSIEFDTSFVALAAPSLEGKTQSAFVFRHNRPFYFPLSEHIRSDAWSPQPIYTNFRSYVKVLRDCAIADLKTIEQLCAFGE